VIDVNVDRSALCTPDGHGGNSYVRTRCLRLADGSSGLAMSTVKRRLSSVTGLDDYLIALGEYAAPRNPCTALPGKASSTRRPYVRRAWDEATDHRSGQPVLVLGVFCGGTSRERWPNAW
jgi:hypothetical protein